MGLKPTCREVHRLASEAMDRELSVMERGRVHVHLLVCQACRNFTAQLQLLRRATRRLGDGEEPR